MPLIHLLKLNQENRLLHYVLHRSMASTRRLTVYRVGVGLGRTYARGQ